MSNAYIFGEMGELNMELFLDRYNKGLLERS